MKRTLLLASIVFCFFTTVSAQTFENIEKFNSQTREYKEKMDSVVSEDSKRVLQYDERFNLIKTTRYVLEESWIINGIEEHRYDAQNHLISTTSYNFNGSNNQCINYKYNENGLLSEQTFLILQNGQWKNFNKQTHEYNSEGLLLSTLSYSGQGNTWRPNTYKENTYINGLIDKCYYYHCRIYEGNAEPELELYQRYSYTYNEKMLCTSMIDEYLDTSDETDVWLLSQKEEYGYDENDNRVSSKYGYYDEDLGYVVYTYKVERVFDDHHNCINIRGYNYDGTSWVIDAYGEYTFDLSSKVEDISGFDSYWNDETIVVTNKMIHNSNFDAFGSWSNTYYYSKCLGIEEQNDQQVLCWPNPVHETLNIRMDDVQQIMIFNMEGKRVLEVNKNTETVDVSTLPQGCYLLNATLNNGGVSTQKFVKQ